LPESVVTRWQERKTTASLCRSRSRKAIDQGSGIADPKIIAEL